MKKSDYVIITIKNNGYAFVETEHKAFETSAENAKCVMAYAMNNYKEVARTTNNGDTTIYFN